MFIISLLCCLVFKETIGIGETFPSLLSRNATIAIVLDREFLGTNYEFIRSEIEKYFIYAKREILKHGGVNVQYFSWTSVNVKRDFTTILNVAPCDDMWKLFRQANEENIMFMAITEPDCPRLPKHFALSIPLVTNGEELPQVLLDLRSANAYSWKSVIILYDATLERDLVTRVVTSLTGHTSLSDVTSTGMSVTFMNLESKPTDIERKHEISKILSDLPVKQLGSNFLVIVSLEYVVTILETAKSLGLVHPGSQWLYAVSDTNGDSQLIKQFSNLIKEGDNIAFVYNFTSNNDISCSKGILCHAEELLDAFCTALDGAIQEETALSSQVSEEEWEAIRPTKNERRDYLLRDINNHLKSFGACNNCSRWRFETGDTWGRSFTNEFTSDLLLTVGHWRPTDGPAFTDELFPHVAHGFRGRNLPIVTYHNPPWQIITTNSSGSITNYKGLVFDILSELARGLNFTFTVYMSPHKPTGGNASSIEVTNFVPDEIIELVHLKKAIIGACGFTVTSIHPLINFTIPISVQSHSFLVARPKELSRALLFIYPFTNQTWLCLAMAVVIVGPILYLVNRYSPIYEARGKVVVGLTSVQNCMWYVYGALLQQGGMYLPEADSSRLIVGTWWLMVLVVVTTYCGNLVAFLTFPKIDIPIKTLNDLITNQETVSWSAIRGTLLEEYLKNSQESKLKTISDKIILYDEVTSDITSQIRERKHVFIGWKTKIVYIMKKEYIKSGSCDFSFGMDDFLDEQIAMIVAKNSPYLAMFNKQINRLHQVGLIENWLKNYLPKRDKCWKIGQLTEVNNHTVSLDDMQGSFFVLFLGFTFAVFWIMLEKIYNNWKLKREKKLIKPFVT